MKIMFVTDNFFPYEGTISNLLYKIIFCDQIKKCVDGVVVVCGKTSYNNLDYEKIEEIEIYRANTWDLYNKKEIKKVACKNKLEAVKGICIKGRSKIKKNRYFYPSLEKSIYKMISKVESYKYDVIICASGRYDSTKAAYKFAKKNNKEIILYQVDPCVTNQVVSNKSYKKRMKFETKLFEYVKGIVTTPFIYNDFKKYLDYKFYEKIEVAELPLIAEPENHYIRKNDNIVCMFLGTIYGGIRNPDYTLELFKKINNPQIELHMVGVNDEEIPKQFRDMPIKCYGKVSNLEAKRLMQSEADILINIGNKVVNQVPSKIFEYISTGKPIINVCKSRECPTIQYFNRYSNSINLYEEEKILKEQSNILEKFILEKVGKVEKFSNIKLNFSTSTPEFCVNQLMKVIKK